MKFRSDINGYISLVSPKGMQIIITCVEAHAVLKLQVKATQLLLSWDNSQEPTEGRFLFSSVEVVPEGAEQKAIGLLKRARLFVLTNRFIEE